MLSELSYRFGRSGEHTSRPKAVAEGRRVFPTKAPPTEQESTFWPSSDDFVRLCVEGEDLVAEKVEEEPGSGSGAGERSSHDFAFGSERSSSSSPTTMSRWNDDVLGIICDDIYSPVDLAQLARVHSSWTGPARTALYRSIRFDYDGPLPLARLLLERPDIARTVRAVYFRLDKSTAEDMRLVREAIWACRHVTKFEVWLGKYADQDRILAFDLADLVRRLPLQDVICFDCPSDVIAAALSHDLDWLRFDVPLGFAWQGRLKVRVIEGAMSPGVDWSSLSSVVTAAADTLEELRVTDGRWDETGVLVKMVYGRMPRLRRLLVRLDDLPPPFMDDILTAHPQLEALAVGACSFSARLLPTALAAPALRTLVIEANGGRSSFPIPELESVLRGLKICDEPPLRVLGLARAVSSLHGLRAEAERLGIRLAPDVDFRGDWARSWPVAEDDDASDEISDILETPSLDSNAVPALAPPPPSSSSSASSSAASSSSASAASFPSTRSGASWATAHSSAGSCHAHPPSRSSAVTK